MKTDLKKNTKDFIKMGHLTTTEDHFRRDTVFGLNNWKEHSQKNRGKKVKSIEQQKMTQT